MESDDDILERLAKDGSMDWYVCSYTFWQAEMLIMCEQLVLANCAAGVGCAHRKGEPPMPQIDLFSQVIRLTSHSTCRRMPILSFPSLR